MLRSVNITRYITPLREGGSMPAVVDADDGFSYVIKFRGAGQGPKVLIAELLGGEIARHLGFKIPELVFATLDESFGRTEPDEEIQDLLKASTGLNLGLHYLDGAITFDPVVTTVPEETASQIVWLDAFLSNMDRTARNTNMLTWHKELWLIDHGASLYFHHSADSWGTDTALKPFPLIKNHVLLPQVKNIDATDADFRNRLSDSVIDNIVAFIPDSWMEDDLKFASVNEHRHTYAAYLKNRVLNSHVFVNEIKNAGNLRF